MFKFCLSGLFLLAPLSLTSAQHPAPTVHTSRQSERVLPLPKEDGAFHFIIYGDRTGGPPEGLKVLSQAVADTNLLDPDLVMTVGDLVPGYSGEELWLKDTAAYKNIMQGLKMPWFPVPGNHDVYWRGPNRPPREHEANYEKHFGPLWYWFKHKNAGFLTLFTDEGDPTKGPKDFTKADQTQMSPEQLEWLKKSLTEMKGLDHIFVFMHHPRWIDRTYKGSNWETVHQTLAAAGNVRAVFAGHIHRMNYGGKRDGIEYFALATTGGSMPGNYPMAGYVHHMNLVTVRPKDISVAILPVGQVMDPRLFTLDRQDDLDKARAITPEILSPKIPLDLEGLGAGLVQFRLTNPSKQPVEMELVPAHETSEWFFAPEHIHTRLEAGETKTYSLTMARVTRGFDAGLALPVMNVNTDYLTEGARVPLPQRKVNLPIGMAPPPTSFFAPPAQNLAAKLPGKSALRVEMTPKDLPNGPFTIEAWVNPANATATAPFIAKTEQSEFALNLANSIPGFHCFIGDKYVSAIAPTEATIATNQWTHIAGVYDGKEMRLYVNGKLAAKAATEGSRGTNVLPLYIGADPDAKAQPTQFFQGSLDEVRISTVARYGENFAPLTRHQTDEQTLHLFHFDAQIGPFIPSDAKGNRYATKYGNATFEPADIKAN